MANRDVSLQTRIFGSTASFPVPDNPVTGVSYRNSEMTSSEVAGGWPFNVKVDSSNLNQVLYLYSSLLDELERRGVLRWSPNTNYETGAICFYEDENGGNIYKALAPSGPPNPAIPVQNIGTFWDYLVSQNKHEVFDIFESLSMDIPLGAFLLNGQLIEHCDSLYPEFWGKAVSYKGSGKIRTIAEAEWQSENNTYGSCGAFVVNQSDNGANAPAGSVRLPNITNLLQPTNGGDVGQIEVEGLPNIAGNFRIAAPWIGGSGAFAGSTGSATNYNYPSGSKPYSGITFSARGSNPIYGRTDHVQPQTVKVYLFIQVFTKYTSAQYSDVDELLSQIYQIQNILAQSDYVVSYDSKLDSDGNWWWKRKWRSNWLEQGGVYTPSQTGELTLTFEEGYDSINQFSVFKTPHLISSSSSLTQREASTQNYSATSFKTYCSTLTSFAWMAVGRGVVDSFSPIVPYTGMVNLYKIYPEQEGAKIAALCGSYTGDLGNTSGDGYSSGCYRCIDFRTGAERTITFHAQFNAVQGNYTCYWEAYVKVSDNEEYSVRSNNFVVAYNSPAQYPWGVSWGNWKAYQVSNSPLGSRLNRICQLIDNHGQGRGGYYFNLGSERYPNRYELAGQQDVSLLYGVETLPEPLGRFYVDNPEYEYNQTGRWFRSGTTSMPSLPWYYYGNSTGLDVAYASDPTEINVQVYNETLVYSGIYLLYGFSGKYPVYRKVDTTQTPSVLYVFADSSGHWYIHSEILTDNFSSASILLGQASSSSTQTSYVNCPWLIKAYSGDHDVYYDTYCPALTSVKKIRLNALNYGYNY